MTKINADLWQCVHMIIRDFDFPIFCDNTTRDMYKGRIVDTVRTFVDSTVSLESKFVLVSTYLRS